MTNGKSAPPKPDGAAFPKARRILRPADFRKVYDEGFRLAGPCFAAFCWRGPEADGPRIGFTAPRALGKAVKRNRMKRRVRECLRRNLSRLPAYWWVVINLRRQALEAPLPLIQQEVGRLIERCKA